ncbi:coiled-coil protein [Legionella nautarum]|uniref:Coiled-coil protein n=1 Tax=Legionella nautarum TaxID=45070 RepID=A0A0W0WL57_9GAMM|nr:helicase-related protein [Legionella nautarum]KTD33039.1 coiled-coil protein [Legionella nautarum]
MTRYFSFRKKRGLLSSTQDLYQWEILSNEQVDQALEIAPLLNPYIDALGDEYINHAFFNKQVNEIEEKFPAQSKKSKTLKISLEKLKKISIVGSIGRVSLFIQVIHALVNKGYRISFNFSEVFLQTNDQSPPAHYSKEDDYLLRDSETYLQLISGYGYQFGKALFNRFRPQIDAHSSETDILVASYYTSIKPGDEKENADLVTPLATLPCFNSSYEAHTYYDICSWDNICKTLSTKPQPRKNCLVLVFTSQDPITELLDSFECYNSTPFKSHAEIIILLQGKAYEALEERERIFSAIAASLHRLQCKKFFHLILLTKDLKSLNPRETLLSLAPTYPHTDDFSPLANNAGYYLSSSAFFATIGYYLEQNQDGNLTSDWLEQAEICPKVKEVKAEEEVCGYIYGGASSEAIRQSKRLDKGSLKSQVVGLTFKYNLELKQEMRQELQQSQALKQNQDLAKQQSITQQRQHQLNEQVDFPFYTPPVPISIFALSLQMFAEEDLRSRTLEEQLQQEVYYTSWYRSNYSQAAIFRKMLDIPTGFLADHIAKILGLAYTISPEMVSLVAAEGTNVSLGQAAKLVGNIAKIASTTPMYHAGQHKMVPLPGYSCESLEDFLIRDIYDHFNDFADGINPACRHKGYSRVLQKSLMQGWDNISTTQVPLSTLPIETSKLALLANREDCGYQSHFSPNLLSFDELQSSYLNSLLKIFTPNRYELYRLPKLPTNIQNYKNSYVFLERAKTLYYIDESGQILASKLTDYAPLIAGLKEAKPIAPNKYWLSSEQLTDWITAKNGVPAPNRFSNPDYIAEKEADFFALIKLTFPEYIDIVNKLFGNFDTHNLDNIRILFQLLISVGQKRFALFLNYLVYLDQKCLLNHFSKIYFSFAPTVFSLVDFFKKAEAEVIYASHNHHGGHLTHNQTTIEETNKSCFLSLAQRTPVSNSEQDWPLFERFAQAVLVFAAKNYMAINSSGLKELEEFWHRVAAKFLIYCEGNANQQRQLLNLFLTHLISKDGLKLAPLRKLDTLLVCLENLIDHTIETHSLWEQIAELEAISLAWTDVPYAIDYNGFHLVCKEMELKAGSMGAGRNSYAVSLRELTAAIRAFNPSSPSLKTEVFRYLGKEAFREQLDFYRNLYPSQYSNPNEQKIYELIWAYYVSAFTGLNYNPHPEEIDFIRRCHHFLQQHPYAKTVDVDPILLISHFLQRLYMVKTNAQKGTMTLWALWQENNLSLDLPTSLPIPEILAHKFERKALKKFLLAHQAELKSCLPILLRHVRLTTSRKTLHTAQAETVLAESLLANFFAEDKQKYEICLQLFKILVPHFGITLFLENLLDHLVLVESIRQLKTIDVQFFTELQVILKENPDLKAAISLLRLAKEKLENQPEHLKPFTLFLHGLAANPKLLPYCTTLDKGLELILDYCLSVPIDETSLPLLFGLYQTLEDDSETLKTLLELMHDKKVYAFFHEHIQYEPSASLLKKATELIKKTNDAPSVLTIIEYSLREKEHTDDNRFIGTLLSLEEKKCSSILFLCSAICKQQNQSPSQLLELLIPIPENYLQTLICLYKHYQIPLSTLKDILESRSVTAAIDALEEEIYQEDLPSYRYDANDLKQKIKEIRYNSWDDKPPKFLTQSERKRLKRDYKKVMDYIENQPVYVEIMNGISCSYTVHQLKNRHFPVVFKALQERISRGENKKENQLALLAVCCVVLKRTCKKFPRSTQLLPLIHSLSEEGQLVQELKTGAGKSIIAALHAALRVAAGRTALVPTENEKLGRDGIVNFKDFYHYLGIRCGERIIEAHSPYSDYVANGINYSTPYGLSLFFISMAIQKKRLPKNRDLIWDEIDASLISTVPFRLAATLEPILLDTKNWSKVYSYLLEFVQEKELFLDNNCSNRDDIHNFRVYCLSKNPDKPLTAFIKRIPDSLLETLFDSARLAVQLEENIDYMVVEKEEQGHKKLYGAPYLPHTSRAEPGASFGAGAQPLLHTEKNTALSDEESTAFSVLPDTETIISMTPKNLADLIRAEGEFIGLTATPGMPDQLGEFHNLYGIRAAYYPSFHPDRCQDLGIVAAEGWNDQKQAALELIRLSREQRQNQPILLICESAQAASDLYQDLNSDEYPWSTQSYYGYSSDPHEEERFIVTAGEENRISISTKCESRGADFDSAHEHGLLVINLCTHLTEEQLIQIIGRCGRNGQLGQFCSIIDVQLLGLVKTAPTEEIAATFKIFQQQIGLKAQQERARTRFLEDSRCLATWYLLDLREKADRILSRQHGRDYSLVETVEFMKTLRDFNRKTESHYFELLKIHEQPNEELKQRFLEYLSHEYSQIVERWLPDEKFSHYQPVEPLVPLQKLEAFEGMNEVKIKQLLAISELLAMGWETLGHQSINTNLTKVEQVLGVLDQYGNDQGGIQTIIGQLVTELELVNIPELIPMLDTIEANCLELLEEIPQVAEGLFSKQKALNYVKEYVAKTKTLLLEKRWQELTLPSLAEDIFSSEDNSSFLAGIAKKGLVNVGGKVGIYALIKFYALPKIMKLLQDQIKILIPDDEAKQLQLMKILQELEPALQDFLTAIPKHLHSKEAIWTLILDKLLPILEHPSIKEAMQLLNNEAGTALEGIVTIIKSFENAPSLKELLDSKTLIPLFKLASQYGLIQLLVKDPTFKEILNRFSLLDPEFFTAFYQSDFKSLFHLIHLLAHPVFFKFLKELPPNANFSQLKAWLNPAADKLPDSVSQAVEALNEYQGNRENREARQAQKIQGLKAKFSLSPEKLQQDLQALKPVFPIEVPPPPIPTPLSSLILTWIATHWLQSLLLLTASILLSWIIIPVILVAAVIYTGVLLWQKIAALMEGEKTYQESYIDPVTVDVSLVDDNSQLRFEILAENVNLPSEGNPPPAVMTESAHDGDNMESTSSIKACYPEGSKRSLGLFINGNVEDICSSPPSQVTAKEPHLSLHGNGGLAPPLFL